MDKNTPKVLYHGSPLKKEILIPKKATGLNRKEDKLSAVYATRLKEFAIVMAILSSSGIKSKTIINIKGKRINGIFSEGEIKSEFVYLYYLSPKSFRNIPKGSHQYCSFEEVKPIRIEEIPVKDYIHLILKNSGLKPRGSLSR